MYRYLKHFTDNITYIYNQRDEGHGISNQIVPEDTNLLIICDSSTNEVDVCKELFEKGIDICILDHHEKEKDNPYATIVNNQTCGYPNKYLSGAGICYKVCQVIDELTSNELSEQYIDLAAIGIYSDVMSVIEPENRYIIYTGLNNIKNYGIKALLKKENINKIDSQTIGFKISPNINASARMGCIEYSINLLLENDFNKCLDLAKQIISLNNDRKKTEIKLYQKIKDRIDNTHNIIIIKTIEEDKIEKGFMGLIATKISEKYGKPSLVVKYKDKSFEGSGRSVNGIKFKEILDNTKLCNWTNGHQGAFGVSFKEENLEKIYEAIKNKIKYNNSNTTIFYDLELEEEEINYKLVKDLEKFNFITNKDCEEAKILIRNCSVMDRKVQGKLEDTIKILSDKINFIKFRTNEEYGKDLIPGKKFDVIGSLKINKWFNNTKGIKRWQEDLQCFIEDYRISE